MTTLTAQPRDTNKNADFYRKQNLVPAVIYGPKQIATAVVFEKKAAEKLIGSSSETERLTITLGKDNLQGYIKAYTNDPLSFAVNHIDIYIPDQTRVATFRVPIHFTGKAPAIEKGAVIIEGLKEIKVECLMADVPNEFTIDLSVLIEPHQSIFVKDLIFSDRVKLLVPPQTPIVTAAVETIATEPTIVPVAATPSTGSGQAPLPSPEAKPQTSR